jgi:hypothetical protein
LLYGTAASLIYITPDEFYEMAPVELYYALKGAAEREQRRSRELVEAHRFQAVLIINYVGHLEKFIADPRDLIKLPWEEGYVEQETKVKAIPEKQSQEDIAKQVLNMASRLGAKKGSRKPDDPPTLLAPQYRK